MKKLLFAIFLVCSISFTVQAQTKFYFVRFSVEDKLILMQDYEGKIKIFKNRVSKSKAKKIIRFLKKQYPECFTKKFYNKEGLLKIDHMINLEINLKNKHEKGNNILLNTICI